MAVVLLIVLMAVGANAAERDALDSALAQIGITRTEFRVDPEVLMTRGGTDHRLPVFDQWMQHPLKIPTWERNWRTGLLASEGKLHPLFNNCAAIIGQGTRRDLIAPAPLDKYREKAKAEGSLKAAIHALDAKATIRGLENVPQPIQEMAAMLLMATKDALAWREMALRGIPESDWGKLYESLAEPIETPEGDSSNVYPFPEDEERFFAQQDALAKIDLRLLMAAGDDLTAMVDTVADELAAISARHHFEFRCATKYGLIALSAGSDDVYGADEPLLLAIDLDGKDVYYTGGGTADANHPVSVVIDVYGNDEYRAERQQPEFGAGVLGFGILTDVSGDDMYTSKGFYSLGCGVAGIGLLRDMSGDDEYDAMGAAQGFGTFGVGILSDQNGTDRYHAYMESQGCGMTMGMGLLCDLLGDDRYTANDSNIIFPSPQSDKHNASLCQGAGYGPRRDYIDAHSLAGGVGMLLDGAGNDQYSGGVFSQAVGYWYGIGILDDRAGNDVYNAVWYGQSATAHMGISYLNDGEGNDVYTATMSVTAGAAHDLSASLFVDESGNDVYQQAANALGRSLNSSVALFADLGGNDVYQGKESMGACVNFSSTGWRAETWTTGVFLDLGGNDAYPKERSNNHLWKQEMTTPLPLLRGVALDADNLKLNWD